MGCCGSSEQQDKPSSSPTNNKYLVQKDEENKKKTANTTSNTSNSINNTDQKKKTEDSENKNASSQEKDKLTPSASGGQQNNPSSNNTLHPPAVPKVANNGTLGSSMNSKSGRMGLGGSTSGGAAAFSSQQQTSSFGLNTMRTAMTHKCSDYLPGMQGNFICDAFCQQRSEEDGGTVWGGGDEIAIELVPFGEQMRDNKNEYTAAAFKALMSTEEENKQPCRKIYAAQSCICRAALHAGVITNEPDENGEQQPQSFVVVALAKKAEDAATLKAPMNDYEARDRYVKHVNDAATLPEVKGALLVKKEWPRETIVGSMGSGVQSFDVSSVVSKWICFM